MARGSTPFAGWRLGAGFRVTPSTTRRPDSGPCRAPCSLVLSHGRYEEALNAANECLRLAQELGESIAEATAMAMIGFIAVSVGEYEHAGEPLRQAIELNQRIGHWRAAASVGMINGLAAYGLGRLDEAAAILEQSMAAHRASGDHFDLALDINAFALVRCDQGRHSESALL